MKTNKNLARYILDENGDVFEKQTGEKVELINRSYYKLTTEEVFKSPLTGKKSNILRRFTVDQIVKVWNDKESELLNSVHSGKKEEFKMKEDHLVESKPKAAEGAFKISVHGIKYKSVKEAAEALNMTPYKIGAYLKKGEKGYINL